jgi:hypothetical protein
MSQKSKISEDIQIHQEIQNNALYLYKENMLRPGFIEVSKKRDVPEI